MKKSDFLGFTLWFLALLAIIFILVFKPTHQVFVSTTNVHPYLMGFVKVSILATMGELLALRIATGSFKKPVGLIYKFIVWGFLGMAFALMFSLFDSGVLGAINKGLLPSTTNNSSSSKVLTAFFTSSLMNLVFGPTFMAFHRVTDTYIDLGEGKLSKVINVKLFEVVKKIDWYSFINFVLLKTIPIFWIPAHTITFLLPPEYRVLMASFLSIALGGILAFSKRKNSAQV